MRQLPRWTAPLRKYFAIFSRSLNPDSYHAFSERSLGFALAYLLSVVALSALLLGVLFAPAIARLPLSLNGTLAQFEKMELDPRFSTKEPVELSLGSLQARIDTSAAFNVSAEHDETLLIDADRFALLRPRCTLLPVSCALMEPAERYATHNISEFTDALEQREEVIGVLWLAFLYALPLLYLSLVAILFFQYLAIALLASIAAGGVARLLRSTLPLGKTFRLAVYALTVPLAISILNIRLGVRMYMLQWLLFLVYLAVSVYLADDGKKGVGGDGEAFI